MAEFGKTPPRSMGSFGVAGLLGENAKVFYSSVFTTRHLGRVSDLLAARLQQDGLDELRLRALLLFGAFEVFRSQVADAAKTSSHRLSEPLVIECGLDDGRVAIGVSFTMPKESFPQLPGMEDRINQGKPQGDFEAQLCELHRHSNQLVVRAQLSVGRIELVAVMGIGETQERLPCQVVSLDESSIEEAPKVQAYIELGDLDYSTLLKEDAPGAGAAPPATGEVLVKGSQAEDPEMVRIKAGRDAGSDSDDVTRVAGGGDSSQGGSDVVRIKGGSQSLGGEESDTILIKDFGHGKNAPDKTVRVLMEPKADEDSGVISNLINKVKQVWPFKTDEDEAETPQAGPSATAAPGEPGAGPGPSLVAEAAANPEEGDGKGLEVKSSEEQDIEKVADDFDKTVEKVQQEVAEIKPDLATARSKRWVDGLMTDLVAEKARIHDMARKLNSSIRQKELEFRQKEQMLKEEVRRKDEQLKQKDNALERAKEQVAQAASVVDRGKGSKLGSTGEESNFKQRYALTQKMLASSKDENAALTAKIDDLKNQLMNAQLQSSKRNQPSMADFSALQTKYERTLKQSDEFKKAYQQMADKLGELKKERTSGGTDEYKKRLERAMQMVTNHQKENERLQIKVEEMQREQMRLQGELNKTSAELKSVAKSAAKVAPAGPAKPAAAATAAKPAVAGAKPAAGTARPTGSGGTGGKGTPPKAA